MDITENIVFIKLEFSLPGQTRKVDASAAAEKQNIAGGRIRAACKLYTGEAFAKIKALDFEARSRLTRLAIPTPNTFRGAYVLPLRMLAKVEELLEGIKKTRADLVSDFVVYSYDDEVERAKAELGTAFDPADFPAPDKIAGQFGMYWSIFALNVPENLPAEVREREMEKLKNTISEVSSDCRQALRQGLADLVAHLAERLTPDPDGKTKRLNKSAIENLREFLDTLGDRDITSDAEIKALGERAKQIIGTTSADDIRGNVAISDRIRAGMDQIAKEASKLIQIDGDRRMAFDDE